MVIPGQGKDDRNRPKVRFNLGQRLDTPAFKVFPPILQRKLALPKRIP
jgi:hypothetical protein